MVIDPRTNRMRKKAAGGSSPPPPETPTDPSFASVRVLALFNGANNSTSIVDSSSDALTMTAYGDAVISTTQSKFGGSSLYVPDSTTSRVTAADSDAADFEFDGDFTVEAWVYPTAAASYRTIVTRYNGSNNAWLLRFDGTSEALTSLAWYAGSATGNYYNFGATIALNEWHHVAVSRSGNSVKAFLDGLQAGSTETNSGTMTGGTAGTMIGSSDQSGYEFPLAGYVDDLRITKGVARYTASFTPPTAQFPTS